MRHFKAEVAATVREATYSIHNRRRSFLPMEVISEAISCTISGEEIGEDQTQPGGMWEQFVNQQQQLLESGYNTHAANEESSEYSEEGDVTGYDTPFTPTFPAEDKKNADNGSETPRNHYQFDDLDRTPLAQLPTSYFQDHNSQDGAAENKEQERDTDIFADFPTCVIESRRLNIIGDDEYGLMAITEDKGWKHLRHDGLPIRIIHWVAGFSSEY